MRYLFLCLCLSFVGCGSFQKMAIRSSSPLFVESGNHMTLEKNWNHFRDSTPGNLKFLEMLYLQDRENTKLLGALVKGYFGYSYAVPETLAFGDELEGVSDSPYIKEAIAFYTKSLDFGVSYFELKGIRKKDLLVVEENKLKELLSKKMDKEDYSTILFTAQSWASLINLQKDNIVLVSLVPRVKLLVDFVCERQPNIENGVCDIFYAQYEAARPRMLGGSPEKGRKLYLEAMKKRPKHLLIRVGYIQFLLLPGFDGEAYEKEARILREEFSKWSDLNRDSLEDRSEYKAVEHLNLFNAIAKKRFEMIEKNKKKIFEEG